MTRLARSADEALLLSCRDVLARGGRAIEVAGAALEAEAGAVLEAHYGANPSR